MRLPDGLIKNDGTDHAEMLRKRLGDGEISGIEFRWGADCDRVFAEETGLAAFDSEFNSGGHKMSWATICVTPLTWLRFQLATTALRGSDRWMTEDWLTNGVTKLSDRKEVGADFVEMIKSGERELPRPVLELDRDGNLTSFQEGRTRGIAAHYADVRLIDVYVATNRTKQASKSLVPTPPSEAEIAAILNGLR